MKKYIITIFGLLLLTEVSYAVPSSLMTVAPPATDEDVIEADDENDRNTTISTPYNAHTHSGLIAENTLVVGSTNAEYSTIQSAINAAVANDVILVNEATYTEALSTFPDNITLRAVGAAENTIITQSATTTISLSTASGVTIDGFTIRLTAADSTSDYCISSANDATSDYNTIKNCIIDWDSTTLTSAGYAVYITDGNTKISNCRITADNTSTSSVGTNGILIGGLHTFDIIDNSITITDAGTGATNTTSGIGTAANFTTLNIFNNRNITITSASITTAQGAIGINLGNTGTAYISNNSIISTCSSTALGKGINTSATTIYVIGNYINATNSDADAHWLNIGSGTAYTIGNIVTGDLGYTMGGTAGYINQILTGDDTTGMEIKFNVAQASVGLADTFVAYSSTTGEEGDVSGTAGAGTIAYNTFLGSHYTQIDLLPTDTLEIGMVLELTGDVLENSMLAKTKICKSIASTKIYGVYGGTKSDEKSMKISKGKKVLQERKDKFFKAKEKRLKKEEKYDEKYAPTGDEVLENEYKIHLSLGVGAGYILVSNKNGNIEAGDLLESDGEGYAQKQTSTTIKSSTIGKAVENVDFVSEEISKKLIGCLLYVG